MHTAKDAKRIKNSSRQSMVKQLVDVLLRHGGIAHLNGFPVGMRFTAWLLVRCFLISGPLGLKWSI